MNLEVGDRFFWKKTNSYYTIIDSLLDGNLKCEQDKSGAWIYRTEEKLLSTPEEFEILQKNVQQFSIGKKEAYEREGGELTDAQLVEIRAESSATDIPIERFTEHLFPQQKHKQEPTQVELALAERGKRYGKFKEVSATIQELKLAMQNSRNWDKLTPSQREALEMIQHKIGRMLNGDHTYLDNAVDIAGYATLMLKNMQGDTEI